MFTKKEADKTNYSKKIIGIDPGQSGGIAVYDGNTYMAWGMPETERDTHDLIDDIKEGAECYIEKVHSMPGQGVASSFKFGKNYGFIRGILIANKVPFYDVTPQKWQKALGVPKRGKEDSKTVHKNRLKGMAQQFFPEAKVTLKTADALLIAKYGFDQ